MLVRHSRKKNLNSKGLALLPEGQGWLYVEFGADTTADAEAQATRLMARLESRPGAPSMRLFRDPVETQHVWAVRESALGATSFVPGEAKNWEGWEDAAVPPARLGEYLRRLRRLMGEFDYTGSLYGHFGQGCVHTRINFDLKTAGGIAAYRRFVEEASDLVVELGGSISGEHGDGQSRGELLPRMYGEELMQAFREFKGVWDPGNRMNPGKLISPYRLDEHLRMPQYRPAEVRTHFAYPLEGSLADAAMRCVGVGKCRKTDGGAMCPSYMATGEEQHTTRGRARLLFEMLQGEVVTEGFRSEAVKDALDLCLSCKSCKSECPTGVDMAAYKAEFLAHYYVGPAPAPAFVHVRPHQPLGRGGGIRAAPRQCLHGGAAVQLADQVGARRRAGAAIAGVRRAQFQAFVPCESRIPRSRIPSPVGFCCGPTARTTTSIRKWPAPRWRCSSTRDSPSTSRASASAAGGRSTTMAC